MKVGSSFWRLSHEDLAAVLAALSPILPSLFSDDGAVTSRATVALLFLAVLLLPGAVAFADETITGLEIPTGNPLVIDLDAALTPISAEYLDTDRAKELPDLP